MSSFFLIALMYRLILLYVKTQIHKEPLQQWRVFFCYRLDDNHSLVVRRDHNKSVIRRLRGILR